LIVLGSGEKSNVTKNLREFAGVINRNSSIVRMEAQGSDGSMDNVGKLESGSADISIADQTIAKDAFEGLGDFANKPHANLRHLVTFGLGGMVLYTLETSSIRSVEDLRGKRIIMQGGSASNIHGRIILQAAQIDPDRDSYCERILHTSTRDPLSEMQDGKFDASFVWLAMPLDLKRYSFFQRSGVRLRFISLEQQVLDKVKEKFGDDYLAYKIESSRLGEKQDVTTLAMTMHLLARKEVSQDAAYEVIRLLYEHTDELSGGFKGINSKHGLLGQKIPLHPGAELFFRKAGLLK